MHLWRSVSSLAFEALLTSGFLFPSISFFVQFLFSPPMLFHASISLRIPMRGWTLMPPLYSHFPLYAGRFAVRQWLPFLPWLWRYVGVFCSLQRAFFAQQSDLVQAFPHSKLLFNWFSMG